MQVETNKLRLTIDDYRCENCGFLHAPLFFKNKPFVRCRRCHTKPSKEVKQ